MKPSYKSEIEIEGKKISLDNPSYFIADIAANHDGDLSRAKDLIYLAKEAGADAAKFQHFQAKTIVSDSGFRSLGSQKSHQSSWKKSVFEVYDDASVSLSWTQELKETCDKAGITFFTSPYAFDLIDEVDPYVPAYKVGSGDITWTEIIIYMAKKNKPYIIATGASDIEDVKRAVDACIPYNSNLALLQCNTNYTASIENMKFINLNVLKTYKKLFPGMILGLSDHTPGHSTVLGAIALGGRVIEKHFTDDNDREGPDHKFSMNPNSWKEMVDRSRELEYALGGELKEIEDNEKETVIVQRRGVYLKNDLKEGDILEEADLELLRPCPEDGVQPYEIVEVIGKRVKHKIDKGSALTHKDL